MFEPRSACIIVLGRSQALSYNARLKLTNDQERTINE